MRFEIEDIEKLDQYHTGNLLADDKGIFELLLKTDAVWIKKNEFYMASQKISEWGALAEFEQKFANAISKEVDALFRKQTIKKIIISSIIIGLAAFAGISFWSIFNAPKAVTTLPTIDPQKNKLIDYSKQVSMDSGTEKNSVKVKNEISTTFEVPIDTRKKSVLDSKEDKLENTISTTTTPSSLSQSVVENQKIIEDHISPKQQIVTVPQTHHLTNANEKANSKNNQFEYKESSFMPLQGEVWKSDASFLENDLISVLDVYGTELFQKKMNSDDVFEWDGQTSKGVAIAGSYFAIVKRNGSEIAWYRIVIN